MTKDRQATLAPFHRAVFLMSALSPAPESSNTPRPTRRAIASLMEARRRIALRMAPPRRNPAVVTKGPFLRRRHAARAAA
jgi:hypothetical protein